MSGTSATNHPYLAHHFDTIEQQRESVTLGMWVFLAQEIMFFGGIFAGYGVYRYLYPEMFHHVSRELDMWLGGINTAVLLTSSWTMVLAVNAAQVGNQKRLVQMLFLTWAASIVFLIVKYFEYSHKFHLGMVPGKLFHWENPFGDKAQIFLSFYFGATGMHGLHVFIGTCILTYFIWAARKGRYPKERYQPVEMVGLYWHFVDLVWIFVFPLFYLIDRS